jgi:MFS transporter, SP family, sugar:H+ symporter
MVGSGPGNANLGTKVFYIWGTTCFWCTIFMYLCIPETKGLSLEQIDLLYQNVSPVHSVSYRKQLLDKGSAEISDARVVPVTTKNDNLASNEKV